MEMIHSGLMELGSLKAPQATRELADLRSSQVPAVYVDFGIIPELVVATNAALHALTSVKMSQDSTLSREAAFAQCVDAINQGRTRKRAPRHIHLLGMAWHYGVRFASAEDVVPSLKAIYDALTPGVSSRSKEKVPQQRAYWERPAELFWLIGTHMRCEPLVIDREDAPMGAVLTEGLTRGVVERLVALMSRLTQPLPMCKLLAISALSVRRTLTVETTVKLMDHFAHRLDDVLVMLDGELDSDSAQGLIQHHRLLPSLSLKALGDLLAIYSMREKGQDLKDCVVSFSSDLIDANHRHREDREFIEFARLEQQMSQMDEEEPEPDPPPAPKPPPARKAKATPPVLPPFDHRQLKIGAYVTGRVNLAAVQVWLVFGVLQPEQSVSNTFTGSWVSDADFKRLCQPHFRRLRISERDRDRAWQFLTMGRVLERNKPRKRVRFNRELSGNPRTEPIVAAVKELASQIDRP